MIGPCTSPATCQAYTCTANALGLTTKIFTQNCYTSDQLATAISTSTVSVGGLSYKCDAGLSSAMSLAPQALITFAAVTLVSAAFLLH